MRFPLNWKDVHFATNFFLVKHKMFGLLCSDEPISAWRCMDEAAVSFGEDITRINCWRHRLGQWMGLGLPCYYLWHLFYEGKLEIWGSCAQYLLTSSRVCFLNAWGSLEPNNVFQITLLRCWKEKSFNHSVVCSTETKVVYMSYMFLLNPHDFCYIFHLINIESMLDCMSFPATYVHKWLAFQFVLVETCVHVQSY
jgi:hypothetical protein